MYATIKHFFQGTCLPCLLILVRRYWQARRVNKCTEEGQRDEGAVCKKEDFDIFWIFIFADSFPDALPFCITNSQSNDKQSKRDSVHTLLFCYLVICIGFMATGTRSWWFRISLSFWCLGCVSGLPTHGVLLKSFPCGSFLCKKVFKGSQWRRLQRWGPAVEQTDINVLSQVDLFSIVIFCLNILVKSNQILKLWSCHRWSLFICSARAVLLV